MDYSNNNFEGNELKNEEAEVVRYDIVVDNKNTREILKNSKEIEKLINGVDFTDINKLVEFGNKAAEEISKSSNVVLNQTNSSQINQTSTLLNALDKVMRKIDINEINKEPSFIDNLFNTTMSSLDRLLSKFNDVGKEIDQIYVQLKLHENDIIESNKILKKMFDANVDYYHELIKYIVAGEKLCEIIKSEIDKKEKQLEKNNDKSIQFEINNLNQCLMVLEQRTFDLKSTENIAMQSIPMINTMAYTNINLVRKINSAFIITLPIFKQALAQSILLKKQKLQTKMLNKLDEQTNELLIKNANNTVELSKESTRMAASSSIKVDTLEKTWQTIVNGIEETKQIQNEAYQKCKEDAKRLENIKKEFDSKFFADKKMLKG